MPTLLVVNREDSFLPPGWVTRILPDGELPTDYEKSGKLWTPVTVPSCAELEKRTASGMQRLAARGLVYRGGKMHELSGPARVIKQRKRTAPALAKVPGPDQLDRSQSTVWDYGTGRTYGTPQAAFDALLAQEGSAAFTETHYIRGSAGTYGQGVSGYVLYVSTVTPSAGCPLVIDTADGETVTWDDDGGDCCLVGSDVPMVRTKGLVMKGAFVGVAPSDNELSRNWRVEDCEMDGSGGVMNVGVFTYNADLLQVKNCRIHDCSGAAIGTSNFYPGDYRNTVAIRGCLLHAGFDAIWSNSEMTLLLANNTLASQNHGVTHDGLQPFTLAVMKNNVFVPRDAGFNCLHFHDLGPADVAVLFSDNNCLFPGSGSVAHFNGQDKTLNEWRALYGSDAESIDADPHLDGDYVPQRESPCLGSGAALDTSGISGKRRALSIDMGHEQVTEATVPAVAVRRMPEIARRK